MSKQAKIRRPVIVDGVKRWISASSEQEYAEKCANVCASGANSPPGTAGRYESSQRGPGLSDNSPNEVLRQVETPYGAHPLSRQTAVRPVLRLECDNETNTSDGGTKA